MKTILSNRHAQRGSALLVTLAFLLLLTILVIGFLTRSVLETQLSTGSATQNRVDLAAQSATQMIIGDLQAEIVAGSSNPSPGVYQPLSPLAMVPYPLNAYPAVATTAAYEADAGVENLVKVSYPLPFWTGSFYTTAGPNRASSILTTTPSLNFRSVSLARWNKPLLMAPTSPTNLAPLSGTFLGPNWIYVARDGSNPGSAATPVTTLGNTSPYVYIPNASLNPSPANAGGPGSNPVTQRYAYAIYNEGGTLDMNVAGSPMNLGAATNAALLATGSGNYASPLQAYKNYLAYADLTQLPIAAPTYWGPSTPNSTPAIMGSTGQGLLAAQQSALINAIVGWRNYASAGVTAGSSFPTYTFTSTTAITKTQLPYNQQNNGQTVYQPTTFDTALLGNNIGFLTTGNSSLGGTSQNPISDNAFASRQQLIQFIQSLGNTLGISQTSLTNLLPYLGTFTRALDAPSYTPSSSAPQVLNPANGGNSAYKSAVPINPGFLSSTVRFSSTPKFVRSDGSVAQPGSPLVNKRFALSRLAWVTWEGPSATVMAANPSDPSIVALENDGIPASYLALGTKQNIETYFGLDWNAVNNYWQYDYHNTGGAPATGGNAQGPIMTLANIVTARNQDDPDFFELLKGAITVGSIGKALVPGPVESGSAPLPGTAADPFSATAYVFPPNFNFEIESNIDAQVLQIGANIIGQYQTAALPIRIDFNNPSLPLSSEGATPVGHIFTSVDNYPYFYGVHTGFYSCLAGTDVTTTPAATTPSLSGMLPVMQIPVIWNPHDPNSSMGAPGTYPVKFRVIADSTDPTHLLRIGTTTTTSTSYQQIMCYSVDTGDNDVSYSGVNVPPSLGTTQWTNTTNLVAPSVVGATIFPLLASTTAVDINLLGSSTATTSTTPNNNLFREPTALLVGGGPYSTSSPYTFTLESANTLVTNPIFKNVTSVLGLNGISAEDNDIPDYFPPEGPGGTLGAANPYNVWGGTGGHQTPTSAGATPYIGIILGAFPFEWATKTAPNSIEMATSGYVALAQGGKPAPSGGQGIYITYRMQYLKPGTAATGANNWVTYDTKYGAPLGAYSKGLGNGFASTTTTGWSWQATQIVTPDYYIRTRQDAAYLGSYASYATDPRTSRFGLFSHIGLTLNTEYSTPAGSPGGGGSTSDASFPLIGPESVPSAATASWVDSNIFEAITTRPDAYGGGWFEGPYVPTSANNGPSTGWSVASGPSLFFHPGFLEQNSTVLNGSNARFAGDVATGDTGTGDFFADPDGVVRRATGGYVPGSTAIKSASTAVGLPLARASQFNTSDTPVTSPVSYLYPGLSIGTPYNSLRGTLGLSQTQSRPYILHRPFRSVAEMGYAFSDTPWRNIDFSTPESGDSALLDVFTLNENTNQNSLEAGKVDLNTRQPYVLAAVLSNAYVDDAQLPKAIANSGPSPTTGATLGSIQLGNAKNAALTIAQALVNRTTDSQDVSLGSGPLQNISELVGKYVSNNGTGLPNGTGFVANGMNSYAGFSGTATPAAGTVKPFTNPNWTTPTLETNLMNAYTGSASGLTPLGPFPTGATPATATGGSNTSGTAALPESLAYIQRLHEAPIRALANVGQTRVWNLMIDVIAQTGRFPSTATSLQSFVVEGERRYWVHVAIDRLTGKVLDEQVEVVKE